MKHFVIPAVIVALAIGPVVSIGTTIPASAGSKAPAGCLARPPHYPGAVKGSDCVAKPDHAVIMAGTTVIAKWSVGAGEFGGKSICAAVSIRNHNKSAITYDDFYWQLQTPQGKIEGSNFEATNDLGSGSIVGGGLVTGNVCFDDPGQTGTYVGLYQPDELNNNRGVWLERL